MTIENQQRCIVYDVGSRSHAEDVTLGFLRQYLESARKRLGTIIKAHGEVA